MSALNFLTLGVFGLDIVERNGVIRISGIRTHDFVDDINKAFATKKVTIHMFTKATRTYVEFYSFFAIDVEYILRKLSKLRSTRLGRRGYTKMVELLVEKTWLSKLDEKHPSIFNKSKLKEIKFDLLKHQAEFIDYYDNVIPKYNLKGMLMAATPGSGKTISSIAIACAFESKNVIVISPKNAVFRVWEKTLKEDMNVEQTVWVHASKTPMPKPSENRWYIFHYESLGDAVALASKLSSERCTVILDESHNLNEMKSLRTERFVTMCRGMKNSLIVELSGTPMKALGSEAIPLISAIDPLFTEECVEKFKKIYGKEAKAATEILSNRLGIIMYKVNKEESKIEEPVEHTVKIVVKNSDRFTLTAIKKDMSDFITERTNYYTKNKAHFEALYYNALKEFESNGLSKLTKPEQYRQYQQYIKEFVKHGYDPQSSAPKALYCNNFEKKIIEPSLTNESRRNFRSAKAVVKYVNLKIRGECLGTVLSKARVACNRAVLESLNLAALIDGAQKKTLVFTSYVEIVKATEVKLKAQGYSPLTVFAETNNNLPAMVNQFAKDESINPMIATYQSLSTAVPLTMANRVILLNAPFRIHEKEQTVARANRIGQDKTVDVYNILLDTGDEPNISTRSSEIMEWSREQVNAIMGFDNLDQVPALESYQEEECMYDINAIISDDLDDHSITLESLEITTPENTTPGTHSESLVSLEHQCDALLDQIETSQDYIRLINNNLSRGITLSKPTYEMYSIISPPLTEISFESHVSSMKRTVLSLESEKTKKRAFLLRFIDFIIKVFKSIYDYFRDVNRVTRSNIESADKLRKLIKAGKLKAFESATGPVDVQGSKWLVRGGAITPDQCLRDFQWQAQNVTYIKMRMSQDLKSISGDFNKRLSEIHAQPGLNQLTHISNKLASLTQLMFESSVSSEHPKYSVYTSKTMLGGRYFVLKYPKGRTSDVLLTNSPSFNLRKATAEGNEYSDEGIKSLNATQALAVLDLVTDINKQLTHISGLINATTNDYNAFLIKTRKAVETFKGSGDDESLIFERQVTLMSNGLKAQATFAMNYLDFNDRASRAALRYVTASAKNHVNN